jgi:hypothetical protein
VTVSQARRRVPWVAAASLSAGSRADVPPPCSFFSSVELQAITGRRASQAVKRGGLGEAEAGGASRGATRRREAIGIILPRPDGKASPDLDSEPAVRFLRGLDPAERPRPTGLGASILERVNISNAGIYTRRRVPRGIPGSIAAWPGRNEVREPPGPGVRTAADSGFQPCHEAVPSISSAPVFKRTE